MQSNKLPKSKVTSRITNPNFIKTPKKNNEKNIIHNTGSFNNIHSKTVIQKVKSARINSILNLSNMNLDSLPREIFDVNIKYDDINWWEMVEIKKLDASNNKISTESFESYESEIYNFSVIPSLNFVKFSFNLFSTVPKSIYKLSNLKYLDFSNNKIMFVEKDIRGLYSLVELNFSNNLISCLPEDIGCLKELEVINFSTNKISSIPNNISQLLKVKRIDFSENLLTQIPLNINNLNKLEELILFKNKISTSENDNILILDGLTSLKYLDLHNNCLTALSSLPFSEKLDTIIVAYNRIEVIDGLKNVANLSVLDLNNNKISNFPEEVLLLKELKTLNLMNNSINDLPPQLCFLKNLVRINLEGNPLKKINSKIRTSNAENIKAYLKTRLSKEEIQCLSESNLMEVDMIDVDSTASNIKLIGENNSILNYFHNNCLKINNLSLDQIPFDAIKKYLQINYLISIDCSNNNITNIEDLYNFSKNLCELKEIKLSGNKINSFPSVNFNNLKILDLKNNLLSTFIEIILDLDIHMKEVDLIYPSLEYLDLSINKFKAIPNAVKFFKNLNVFLISNNQITDVSNFLSNRYDKLATLDLGNNKIEIIAEKLYKNFPNLKIFNLENNDIKIIPTDICIIHSLNKLNLNGNPIKMLRSNITNSGTKSIMDFLRRMHKFDNEDIFFDQKYNQINIEPDNSYDGRFQIQESNNKEILSELSNVNDEIIKLENELSSSNLPIYKKVESKKKLNLLIRYRATLMK